MSNTWPPNRVHIIGVGGAGMSGVARYLSERGCQVSGSDRAQSDTLRDLTETMNVYVGSNPDVVKECALVTTSPAIRDDDPELTAARAAGIPILSRAAMLGRLSQDHDVVAFAGTHGKTTATSMYLMVAKAAKQKPSWLLGAPVTNFGKNGGFGSRQLVLELDESYGTFEQVEPSVLGLLNVEADHLDHYGDLEGVQKAFRQLVSRTKQHVVVWCNSTAHELVRTVHSVVTVGEAEGAAWRVLDVAESNSGSSFTLDGPNGRLVIQLQVPGYHNVMNAAIVAVSAMLEGIPIEAIERGLASFQGAPRRYEVHGVMAGTSVQVIEDYAHLPSEIQTTITTALGGGGDRDVVAIFQPHRVTRTVNLSDEFGPAFSGLRELVVTDIYTSGEANPNAVTGELIVDAVHRHSTVPVRYLSSREEAAEYVRNLRPAPEVVLVLGAGDIGDVARWLTEGHDGD